MENRQTFGAFICQRRKDLGLTQKEFAQRLYVTDSAVSKWERGLAYPDITLLQSICDILQISEKELLSASEDTEGRRAEQLARQYLRLLRNYRLIQYILYGLTLAACFITNLAVQHTLSWFWIVLVGCALGTSLTLLPVLAPEGLRGLWTLGGFTAALLLLLAVCCVYTGGTWFWVAAASILFGLGLVFGPYVLRRLSLPESLQHIRLTLYLGAETCLLLLLLAVCCIYTGGTWFWVAAAAVLFGLGLVFGPLALRQLPLQRKALAYTVMELLLLLLLYSICCLYSGGTWFVSAALWTLLGLGGAVLPGLMGQLPLPAGFRHKALLWLGVESVLLLLCLAWEGLPRGWFLSTALPIALLCLTLPWGWLGCLRYLPVNRWLRASAASFWAGLWLWLFPWGLDRIFLWNGRLSSQPYSLLLPVNFLNWTDLRVLNANIMALVLLGLGLLGAVLLAIGLRKARK